MLIIIDGYNLLRAVYYHEKGKLTKERAQLVRELGQYRDIRGHDIVIVFDAGPALHATREVRRGVVVMFSGQNSNADEWIISFVKREREKEKVLVSRDRSLVDQCKQYGTEELDPEVFYRVVREKIAQSLAQNLKEKKQHGGLKKFEQPDDELPAGVDQDELDAAMIEASLGVASDEGDASHPRKRVRGEKVSKKERKRSKVLDKL